MGTTAIEWTDFSINPIRAENPETGGVGHYCEMVSAGCAHCYSSTFQRRFHLPKFPGNPGKASTAIIGADGKITIRGLKVFLDESKLLDVLRRRKPTKYFWCDMTDMFGSWVPDEWIDKCFATMALTPHHTHQVLTKRPERMAGYFADLDTLSNRLFNALEDIATQFAIKSFSHDVDQWPPTNVWLGTSVENQEQADKRIPWLLKTPAAVRFLSCEPLLGPIDLATWFWSMMTPDKQCAISWTIVGGESGIGARPCQLEWIEEIRNQCKNANVRCFVKQLGSRPMDRAYRYPVRDKKGGDPAEWPEDLRVRQFPAEAHA